MAHGIQIRRANGALMFDGGIGLTIREVFTLAAGTGSGSKSYPELAGFTLHAMAVTAGGFSSPAYAHILSISYGAGYPVLSWTLVSPSVGSHVYVFAR